MGGRTNVRVWGRVDLTNGHGSRMSRGRSQDDMELAFLDLAQDLQLQVGVGKIVGDGIPQDIHLDDLKVVEGVGPKIAELCSGIGIATWRGLADADVADLRSMLSDAGSRYQVHDPTTWPAQAACLADGRWADFVALTAELGGGR